jgi:hypothetical protein
MKKCGIGRLYVRVHHHEIVYLGFEFHHYPGRKPLIRWILDFTWFKRSLIVGWKGR